MKSLSKKLLTLSLIVLLGAGTVFASEKYLGLDVEETVGYVTDQVAEAKNSLKSMSFTSFGNNQTHHLDDLGPMEGTGRPQGTSTLADPVNTGEEYSFDETTYPYRAMLGETEQEVYNQVYANAYLSNSSMITLVDSLSEESLENVMNAVFNDHPELFWLNTSYKYKYDTSENVVAIQLSFGISSKNLETAESKFDSAVETIVSGAEGYSSEIEKELYIHDAICSLATYNENASLNQSAYSALVSGKTVCAGYARAFQYVCREAGITCYYATGTASGGDHAWNVISVGGDFYNVDLTWDDSISESYGSNVYTYFNLTDSAFENHTRTGLSVNLPSCTATAMSYTNVYGETLSIDDITTEDDSTVTDGDFTIDEPADPIVQWDQPSQPDQSTTQPDQSTSQPDQSTSQPDQSMTQPDQSTTQPDQSTSQPSQPSQGQMPSNNGQSGPGQQPGQGGGPNQNSRATFGPRG